MNTKRLHLDDIEAIAKRVLELIQENGYFIKSGSDNHCITPMEELKIRQMARQDLADAIAKREKKRQLDKKKI